jgi:ATP-binding cassette, subfamily B, bacterial
MPDTNMTLLKTLKRFWPSLRSEWRKVLLALVASLLASGLAVLAPMPIKTIIDEVLQGQHPAGLPPMAPTDLVLTLAAIAALLAVLSALFSALEKMISARLRERMTIAMRLLCLDRLLLLTPLCQGEDRSGELGLRLIDDVQQVARLFTKTMPVIIRHILTLLFTLGALIWISPVLGAAAVGIAVILAIMVRFAAAPLRATAKAKRVQEGRVAGLAQEILRSLSFLQSASAERQIRNRFEDTSRESLSAGVDETRAAVRLERIMQIANGLAVALIVGGGGWLALRGKVSAGDLAIAVLYLNQMLRPIEKINELASAISGATSRAGRLTDLLDRDERLERSGTHQVERAEGRITLASPEFAYADGRDFHYDAIVIPARSFVSIEGPSGSGKSTLLALLTRLFDPQSGAIQLDGTPFVDWDITNLRRQFAVSPQSPPLMAGTVRDWMRLGNEAAIEAEHWSALKAVSLAEMLRARGGLDAPLGEAGAGLSGGEQSRLALARALAAGRPVLLLDEPFANVDPVSVKVILNALRAESGKRTIIIVTHQPLPSGMASLQLHMAAGRLSVVSAIGQADVA